MHERKLKELLEQEVKKVARTKSFEEWMSVKDPITYECGLSKDWYQVEVQILERNSSSIHISVSVDDSSFLRSIFPLSRSFIVYSDGKVDI